MIPQSYIASFSGQHQFSDCLRVRAPEHWLWTQHLRYISFTLVIGIMCVLRYISFTLVIGSICGFKYISSTSGYQPVQRQACQLRFSYISFTVGYQPMWLQLYQVHF